MCARVYWSADHDYGEIQHQAHRLMSLGMFLDQAGTSKLGRCSLVRWMYAYVLWGIDHDSEVRFDISTSLNDFEPVHGLIKKFYVNISRIFFRFELKSRTLA